MLVWCPQGGSYPLLSAVPISTQARTLCLSVLVAALGLQIVLSARKWFKSRFRSDTPLAKIQGLRGRSRPHYDSNPAKIWCKSHVLTFGDISHKSGQRPSPPAIVGRIRCH